MTSTASGVGISAGLKSAYQSARTSGNVALIKVQIVNDTLDVVKTESRSGGGGWARDFDLVGRHLDKDQPCFIIFFKSKDSVVLLQYVPEESSVRSKMQYSASKSALNSLLNARQFNGSGASSGSSKSVDQYFATTPAEMTHAAYTRHTTTVGPMSEVEEALSALPKTVDKKDFGKSMVRIQQRADHRRRHAEHAQSTNAAQFFSIITRGSARRSRARQTGCDRRHTRFAAHLSLRISSPLCASAVRAILCSPP